MCHAYSDMRDMAKKPYSPEEMRVVEYLMKITNNSIGAGDDPIGFLIASHADAMERLNTNGHDTDRIE